MVQSKPIAIVGSHEPTDSWVYTHEDEDGSSFWANLVMVADSEYAVFVHIYADNETWKISGGSGGGGVDEVQRLWFDAFQVADDHIRATFARVVGGQ